MMMVSKVNDIMYIHHYCLDVIVLTWLSDNLCQAVGLAIECKWSGVLMSALDGNEIQRKESLQTIR